MILIACTNQLNINTRRNEKIDIQNDPLMTLFNFRCQRLDFGHQFLIISTKIKFSCLIEIDD